MDNKRDEYGPQYDPEYRDKTGDQWYRENLHPTYPVPYRAETGPTSMCADVEHEKDVFKLFMTHDIFDDILRATNERGIKIYGEHWKQLDHCELTCFIAIYIANGLMRMRKRSFEQLMKLGCVFSPPITSVSMSTNRIREIRRCLCFITEDDKISKQQNNDDVLIDYRDIHDKMERNFSKIYVPGPNFVVDEQLMGWHGKLRIIQYIPSKPDKYGIKFFALCCAHTGYCVKRIVYEGKKNGIVEKDLARKVVVQLTDELPPGSNLTTDNYFTNVNLAHDLRERGISLTGTMNLNRRTIPRIFTKVDNQELYSTRFAYNNGLMMLAYRCKVDRQVVILSTLDYINGVCDDDEQMKPHIVLRYNETKGGVDTLDKLIKEYSCRRISRKYTSSMFFHDVDTVLVNSYIVWASLNNYTDEMKKERRAQFLMNLVLQLVSPYLMLRLENRQTPRHNKEMIRSMFNIRNLPPERESPQRVPLKRKRCEDCKILGKDSKTQYVCEYCDHYKCLGHADKTVRVICRMCKEFYY